MTRVLAAVCLVAVAAAAAVAGDFEPGSVRAEIAAAAKDAAPDRAVAILEGLLADGAPRNRARHVEAAKAAVECLPADVAAPLAGRLLAEALRLDPGNAGGAWQAAQDLRRSMLRRADSANGVPFLTKLIEIYPGVIEYRHDLSVMLLDAGRRIEAQQVLADLTRMAPSDTRAAYTLASLVEQDGDLAGAIAVYDRLIGARPAEIQAQLLRARVVSRTDRDAARRALDEAVRAAESLGESRRTEFLDSVTAERARLDDLDRRNAEIERIETRQRRALAGALAVWAVIAAAALFATRAVRAAAPSREN